MDDGLRGELVAMGAADTAAVAAFLATADGHRAEWEQTQTSVSGAPWPYLLLDWQPPPSSAPEPVGRVREVVAHNTTRLKTIVAVHGWPGRSLVGEDGADAAWLILQHAGSAVATIGTADNDAFRRTRNTLNPGEPTHGVKPMGLGQLTIGRNSVNRAVVVRFYELLLGALHL